MVSCACSSCWLGARTLEPEAYVLLIRLLLPRLMVSTGSSQIARIRNSSAADHACDLIRIWFSPPTSLFFLGLPLLHGICSWRSVTSNLCPSDVTSSTLSFAQGDTIISTWRLESTFEALGTPTANKNYAQTFCGLGLVLRLPWGPCLAFWGVPMVRQRIYLMCGGFDKGPKPRSWSNWAHETSHLWSISSSGQ